MSKIALLFLMTYAGGLGACLLVGAVWGFYLYQLVYFLYPQERWWAGDIPGIRYSFIVSLFILIAYAARYKSYQENRLFEAPQTKWLIMLLVVFALTSFVAVNQDYHQQALFEVFKLFIMVMLGYKLIDTPLNLDRALWAYIIGATYLSVEVKNAGRDEFGRVEGVGTVTTDDANGVAAMLVPAISLLIFYAWRGGNLAKVGVVVLGVFIFNAIVLFNSRGAFLAVIAGGGYFIFHMLFSRFQQANQKLTAILIIMAGLSGALYLTDDVFWERMETLKEVQSDEGKSGSHRVHMWMSTFDLVADYPFGVGAAGFQKLSQQYVPEEFFFRGQKAKAVHSAWFQCLSEVGWVGLFLFLTLLLSCFRLTARTKRVLVKNNDSHNYFLVIALEAALLSFMVAGTFIDEFRSEIYYWFIMFTACAGNIFLFKATRNLQTKT